MRIKHFSIFWSLFLFVGTTIGDEAECSALANFFGYHRKDPLLLGSVKSNIGHTEMVSGLSSLIKVLGVMKTGIIPPTINVEPIDTSLKGIKDGKIAVCYLFLCMVYSNNEKFFLGCY